MEGMHHHLAALIVVSMVTKVHPALVTLTCDVSMDTPEYYEPTTDIGSLSVTLLYMREPAEVDVGVNHGFISFGVSYDGNTPRDTPGYQPQKVSDTLNSMHDVNTGFNGSHVCIVTTHHLVDTPGLADPVETCVSECRNIENLPDVTWNKLEFFRDNSSDVLKTDYLEIEVERRPLLITCRSQENEEDIIGTTECAITEVCGMSVSKEADTGRHIFQPGCVTRNRTLPCTKSPVCTGEGNAQVCNYCCRYALCNDVRQCDNDAGTCHFYGPPPEDDDDVITDAPGGTSDNDAGSVVDVRSVAYVSVMLAGLCMATKLANE